MQNSKTKIAELLSQVQAPPPVTLFKYRKFDKGCLEMLLNRELWFAEPATLNDPFEGESSYGEVLEAVWAVYPIPLEKREQYQKRIRDILNKSGICSFSKARKNQLMWSHYSDEHRGVCIGFHEKQLRPVDSKVYPIDVTYQDDYPSDGIIQRFKYFEKHEGVNSFESILGDIIFSILGTKYTSWSYERERRLMFPRSKAISFDASAVNSIAFGLRMSDRDKSTIRSVLASPEWSHVKWVQAVKSKKKYSLEFESIL